MKTYIIILALAIAAPVFAQSQKIDSAVHKANMSAALKRMIRDAEADLSAVKKSTKEVFYDRSGGLGSLGDERRLTKKEEEARIQKQIDRYKKELSSL